MAKNRDAYAKKLEQSRIEATDRGGTGICKEGWALAGRDLEDKQYTNDERRETSVTQQSQLLER